MNNWKDISKEKPKKGNYVIVQDYDDVVFPSYYCILGKFEDLDDKEVEDLSSEIKYWMYLPNAKDD